MQRCVTTSCPGARRLISAAAVCRSVSWGPLALRTPVAWQSTSTSSTSKTEVAATPQSLSSAPSQRCGGAGRGDGKPPDKECAACSEASEHVSSSSEGTCASARNGRGRRSPRRAQRWTPRRFSQALEHANAASSVSGGAGEVRVVTEVARHQLQDVQKHYSLIALKHKMEHLAHSLFIRFVEWRVPVETSLRHLGEMVDDAIKSSTFESLSHACDRIKMRLSDPAAPAPHPMLRILHARALANFGLFCLVNFESRKAIESLRDAIDILSSFSDADVETVRSAFASSGAGQQDKTPIPEPSYFSPQTASLYLRVLIANALACEQQHWDAAEQLHIVRRVRQQFPLLRLVQLTPGPRGYQLLQDAFVNEEIDLFYKNAGGAAVAIAQGQAKLLLMKSMTGAHSEQHRSVLLSLARIHRRVSQFQESQGYYEAYLEQLVQDRVGDTEHIMHEFGQMLLYNTSKKDLAQVYLKTAAESLVEDAHDALSSAKASRPIIIATCARAATALMDASHALHALGSGSQALELLDECLKLLERSGLKQHSAWALKHSADLLCCADEVDEAILRYSRGIDILRESGSSEGTGSAGAEQIAVRDELVMLKVVEIEMHLGYCFQVFVGDYASALRHYLCALKSIPNADPDDGAAVREDGAAVWVRPRKGFRSRSPVVSPMLFQSEDGGPRASSVPRVENEMLPPDTRHWVLGNVVECCAHLKDWKSAVEYQKQLLHVEALAGVPQTDSYLKMADLLQRTGDIEKQLALFFFLFFLPDEMLSPAGRLVVAHRFGKCCYHAGSSRIGAVLLQAVQKAQGGRDPVCLVEYALCLKHLDKDSDEITAAASALLPRDIETIGNIFRRAASLAVAQRGIEAAEKTSRSTENELNALMVLNRGAFFFLEIGREEEAVELYNTALSYCNEASASGVAVTAEYCKEWSIVLANSAMLMSRRSKDSLEALKMYRKAVEVCPTNSEVLNAAAVFCQNEGHATEGCVFLHKALELPCEKMTYAAHLLLTQVGNSLFPAAECRTRYLVMCRLVLTLGLPKEDLPTTDTVTADNYDSAISALEPLIEKGVAGTHNVAAVNLACYMLQIHFKRPKFLNRLFRVAISRFPLRHELLFNYANFCSSHGFHVLARKYFAWSLGLQQNTATVSGFSNYLQHSVFDGLQDGTREQLLRSYAERHPADCEAWCHYATLLSRSFPSPRKAEQTFEAALRINPESLEAISYFAEFLCLSVDSVQAHLDITERTRRLLRVEQLLTRGVDLAPTQPRAHLHLGVFYASADRLEEALRSLQRALELDPSHLETLRHISSILKKECIRLKALFHTQGERGARRYPPELQHRMQQAVDVYERALELEPDHVPTLEEYAQFSVSVLNNPKQAKDLWLRASKAKLRLTK